MEMVTANTRLSVKSTNASDRSLTIESCSQELSAKCNEIAVLKVNPPANVVTPATAFAIDRKAATRV